MGEEAVPSAGPLQSAANKWSVLTCVLLGSFTVILNNSMLNVSIPSFMKLFHIGASEAQWVITGFMLPMMIMMTISGYLSDVLGQKTAYIAGMLLFLAGSAFGAMAWSFHSIVGFRIVQGLGAGLVMPLGITIIFHNFPERERGLATGISGIASMAAPAVGPTLGGMVLQVSSWHTLFLLNIPTGVICLTATLFCLKGRRLRVRVPFDRLGFAGIAVGMTCLMLGMNRLPQGLGGTAPSR
ncbi:MFS transporter [Paenibacillus sp. TAB 01]|uniref:MFS transporter n=1 Tax=Paenibacillus sp. TAB 01 TaxID=3368988 RepID=UPI00375276A0